MSWALGTTGAVASGTGTVSPAYPASISGGDILLLAAGNDTGGYSFTLGDAGFVAIQTNSTYVSTGLWWKIATGGETGTTTVAPGNASETYAQIVRFTGGPSSLTGSVHNSNNRAGNAAADCFYNSLTITVANTLLVGVGFYYGTSTTGNMNNPAPFTAAIGQAHSSFDAFTWNYAIQTAATSVGAGSWTPTGATSINYSSFLASLLPGSGGGGGSSNQGMALRGCQ